MVLSIINYPLSTKKVISGGIEPPYQASETYILSIVLRDLFCIIAANLNQLLIIYKQSTFKNNSR
jgi:hypothetical protein